VQTADADTLRDRVKEIIKQYPGICDLEILNIYNRIYKENRPINHIEPRRNELMEDKQIERLEQKKQTHFSRFPVYAYVIKETI